MKNSSYLVTRERINEAKPNGLERLACEALYTIRGKVNDVRSYAKRNKISLEAFAFDRLNNVNHLKDFAYLNEVFDTALPLLAIFLGNCDTDMTEDYTVKMYYSEDAEQFLCNLITAPVEFDYYFLWSALHDCATWWIEVKPYEA